MLFACFSEGDACELTKVLQPRACLSFGETTKTPEILVKIIVGESVCG